MRTNDTQPNATAASLLGFLYWQPLSGGDLATMVEGSLAHFWHVTRSQIYRELRTLCDAGLIESRKVGLRGRRPYEITDQGREVFLKWLNEDPGQELFRSPFLIKFFFGILLERSTIEGYVAAYRKNHESRLDYFEQLLPNAEKTDPVPAHVVRFGIAFEKAVLEWIDTIPWEIWDEREQERD